MVSKTYQQEKGDFTVAGTTWYTDGIVSDNSATRPPYSEIKVISKHKIWLMINGFLERKKRSSSELIISGIGSIMHQENQVLACMAKSNHCIVNIPISCIVNNSGILKIEHDSAETDWYRISGFLKTTDYPIFHYPDQIETQ